MNHKKLFSVVLIVWCLTAGLGVFLIMPGAQANSAYFRDGFESGDHNAWDSETGTVDVVEGVHNYTGSYSANVTATGPADDDHYLCHVEEQTLLFFSCHYYVDTIYLSSESYPQVSRLRILTIDSDGPERCAVGIVKCDSGYNFTFYGGEMWQTITNVLATNNSWYELELMMNFSIPSPPFAEEAFYKGWINSTKYMDADRWSPYSASTDCGDVGTFRYDGTNSFLFKGYFDNCVFDAEQSVPEVGEAAEDEVLPVFITGIGYPDTEDYSTNVINATCQFVINVTDNVGLSGYIFSIINNSAGTWFNGSWHEISGEPVGAQINENWTMPNIDELFVQYRFYVNDTSDNWAQSDTFITACLQPVATIVAGVAENPESPRLIYENGNSAGVRRTHRGLGYFLRFWSENQTIYYKSSPNGYDWSTRYQLLAGISWNDTHRWATYVWGNDVYLAYHTGTYHLGWDITNAWVRHGILSDGGIISWDMLGRQNLTAIAWDLIVACMPDPSKRNMTYIYGRWSYTFTQTKDESPGRIYLAFGVAGEFYVDSTRVFIVYTTNRGVSWTAYAAMNPDTSTDIAPLQMSVTADPYYDLGFVFFWKKGAYTTIYYMRNSGTAWLKVESPERDYYWGYIHGVTGDWSTTHYKQISRVYLAGKGLGTYYFTADPNDTFKETAGGPGCSSYDYLHLAHTDQRCYLVGVTNSGGELDTPTIYYWYKEGETPQSWSEAAHWGGARIWVKTNHTLGLSTLDYTMFYGRVMVDWANETCADEILYYGLLDGLLGSPTFDFGIDVDLEGCGDWIFTDHRYYSFNVSTWHVDGADHLDTIKLRFSTPTWDGDVANTFTFQRLNENTTWTLVFDPDDSEAEPTRLAYRESSNISSGNWLYTTFEIWFTRDCKDVYEADCVDIYLWANDTGGFESDWQLISADLFHIYVLGGFSMDLTVDAFGENGAGGRVTGGDVFHLWARNGCSVETDMYFRHWQHVKILPEVICYVGYPTFYIEYEMDYCTDADDWIEGWKIRIDAEAVTYGTERHFNWTVRWYMKDAYIAGTWENILMFHSGEAAGVGEITATRFWIDLWFNKLNASSTVGGRINAYQWAMKDNANQWLRWLSTNWGPYDKHPKQSMFFYELQNTTGHRIHAPDIKMCRLNCKLYVAYNAEQPGQQFVELRNYDIFDVTLGDLQHPFQGVQTPTFEETVTPVMPMGGWIGAIWTGLAWLGAWLADNIIWGGLGLWPAFVGFMDTIAAWLGYPSAFSNLIMWLGSAWVWLVSSFGYLIALLGPTFSFLGATMGKFITLVSTAVTNWVAMIQEIWNFMDGTYTDGVHIFNDLGVMNWIILACIVYPIHLVILWDDAGFGPVEREIRLIWDTAAFLISGFIQLVQLVLSVIGRIIESIPVVE